jgi:hypothetical protein
MVLGGMCVGCLCPGGKGRRRVGSELLSGVEELAFRLWRLLFQMRVRVRLMYVTAM